MVSPVGDDFFVVTNSVRPLLVCPYILVIYAHY